MAHPNQDSHPADSLPSRSIDTLKIRIPMLDFARQYAAIGPQLLAAVAQVFASQHFILGEQVSQFERTAAGYCQAGHGVGCSSGTDALWLALAAAEIGPGDAVVTTPFSFFATVSSILRAGARPLLADIDPSTYNLDPSAVEVVLEQNCKAGIKAVLPVHLYGQTAEWNRFQQIKRDYSLIMIEDAAQAFGAAWDGVPAGSLGDLAAFSFYPTKNLSACGDAGLLTTSDDRLAERARMLRVHGMRRRYYHDEVGWNCRMDTLQAAVLLVKMQFIERWNERRRAVATEYGRLFAAARLVDTSGPYPEHGVVLPYAHPRAKHVFHQYVIRVGRRDQLRAFLQSREIGSEVYYPVPLHQQECLKDLGYQKGDLPESERAAEEVLALPIFPELTAEEQQTVVTGIADFLS